MDSKEKKNLKDDIENIANQWKEKLDPVPDILPAKRKVLDRIEEIKKENLRLLDEL